ncbi:MAG: serine/threonine protein kinase [Planctomycetes bacterium]|nr:serine/threonine protein kinase [Planctomycetota bacterium]
MVNPDDSRTQDLVAPQPTADDDLFTYDPASRPTDHASLRLPAAIGRYQIHAEIGEGGFGKVYLAWDPPMSRNVAVKTVSPDVHLTKKELARFEREARLAGAISHPAIVKVWDVGVDEVGNPYIVQEYVEGLNLRKWLRGKALSPREAFALLLPVVDALAHAHERGVVHRDIKPDNIFIDSEGHAKLGDFGLARQVEASRFTTTGRAIGTLAYMSPEQTDGLATTLSDVYGIGAVCYEVMTGKPPFHENLQGALLNKVLFEPPIAPSVLNADIGRKAEAICLMCLEKSPEKRFQGMLALGVAMKSYLADKVADDPAHAPADQRADLSRRGRIDDPEKRGVVEQALSEGRESSEVVRTQYCPACRRFAPHGAGMECRHCGSPHLRGPSLRGGDMVWRLEVNGRAYLIPPATAKQATAMEVHDSRSKERFRHFLRTNRYFSAVLEDIENSMTFQAQLAYGLWSIRGVLGTGLVGLVLAAVCAAGGGDRWFFMVALLVIWLVYSVLRIALVLLSRKSCAEGMLMDARHDSCLPARVPSGGDYSSLLE